MGTNINTTYNPFLVDTDRVTITDDESDEYLFGIADFTCEPQTPYNLAVDSLPEEAIIYHRYLFENQANHLVCATCGLNLTVQENTMALGAPINA